MKNQIIVISLVMAGCDSVDRVDFRVACSGETTGQEEPPSPPPPPPAVGTPTPTTPCPEIVDGVVTFCPDAMSVCREAIVANASGASGSGPLVVHWHGTGETPEDLLSWDYATSAIRSMVDGESGLLVIPRADSAAVARPNNPFPWWVVCGETGSQCSRPDDFILADEIVACVLEQQLASPDRITTSGMSAGGIMTAHLVDRLSYLAGAVSWSGGMPAGYQPTTPASSASVLAIHGGTSDLYCGSGQAPGTCYGFQEPTEALALDVANAGRFAFVCDHQSGHSAAMGGEGAAFLGASNSTGHAWTGYPFGYPGSGPSWMLNHYCYAAGTPSPWMP